MQQESHQVEIPHDGKLLPMDAMAVRPYFEEDLAALVAQVPVCLAPYLANLASLRARE